MESPAARSWFLRKHADGAIFGPLSFAQLAQWAALAQVAPQDWVSHDQESWIKAPMLPELAMDWIVEVTSESLYGPTTLGAIREFLHLGEIDHETFIINTCDTTRRQIRDLIGVIESIGSRAPSPEVTPSAAPATVGMAIAVEDRIRELEQALREERRALAEAEARYLELEAQHRKIKAASAASERP